MFAVPAGATLTAATYELAPSTDTVLDLFDQDGTTLLKFLTDRLRGSLDQLGCTHKSASRHPDAAAEPDAQDQAGADQAKQELATMSNG